MSIVSENCGAAPDPFLGRCPECGRGVTHRNRCDVPGRGSVCALCYAAVMAALFPDRFPARPAPGGITR